MRTRTPQGLIGGSRLAGPVASALVTLALAPLVRAAPPERPPPFAIKDARIVVAPGKVLERATIVFRDGRVEAVGASVTPPADAVVEDGRGLTVYPGFIDAGCPFPIEAAAPEAQKAREGAPQNLQEDPPIETPEARRKGIRSALDLAASALLDGERRQQERRAGFTAALAVPPRAYLAGRSALFALGERPRRSSVLATPAFLHAGFEGPEGERGYPSTLMGAHAHIRQAFADALRQRELEARDARNAKGPRAPFDPDLDALLPAIDRKLRVAWAADTDEDVARTLALGAELGLELVVTDARHAAKSAAALRRAHVKVILSLAWTAKPKPALLEAEPAPPPRKGRNGKPLDGPYFFTAVLPPVALVTALPDPAPIGTTTKTAKGEKSAEKPPEKDRIDPTQEPRAVFEERERRRAEEVGTLKALYAAGVPVAVSSVGLHGPAEVREHLREAIKAGLSEDDAIAVLTRDAALVLGVQDRLGTLAPGKLAYATVLTGSFADEKAKVRFTVVDGERLEAEKLDDDQRLARLSGKYRFDAGLARGELVLEVFAGKLSARVRVEGREAAVSSVTFENDRVKLALPKDVLTGEKKDVPIDARWIAPDALEGTATFGDGARVFRADREPAPKEEDR